MIKYRQGESFLHGLGTRKKLAALIALSVAGILAPIEWSPAFFLLALGVWRAGFRFSLLAEYKELFLAGAFVFVVRALLEKGSVAVFSLVVPKGVFLGILNFFYLTGLFVLALAFILSTKPSDLAKALEGIVSKKNAFLLVVALQAVPVLQAKALKVKIAQQSRGSTSLFAFLTPLLNSVFYRARKLGLSLEARGFDPSRLE